MFGHRTLVTLMSRSVTWSAAWSTSATAENQNAPNTGVCLPGAVSPTAARPVTAFPLNVSNWG